MSVPAFFLECSLPFWPPLLTRLQARGFAPLLLTGAPAWEKPLLAACPGAVFQASHLAVRGLPFPGLGDLTLPALDAALLTALAPWQHVMLKMMDRMDAGNAFTYQERVEHYYHYLRLWSAVLDRLRPQVIVYSETPHMGYDYALFLLARQRGIRNIMIDRTSMPGLLYLQDDPETGWESLADAYAQCLADPRGESLALSPQAVAYLERIRAPYDQGMPVYIKNLQERSQRDAAASSLKSWAKWCLTPRLWAESARKTRDFCLAPAPPNYVKRRGRPYTGAGMGGLEWRIKLKRRHALKARLRQDYDRLAGPVDLNQPFIFVALHYQPEKTTSPLGGYFADQQLMLDMLAECLPPGWRLYVKEALGQFAPNLRGEDAKSRAFYQAIVDHPRMRLLPMEYVSFELIDKCRAVATVTGTAAWEAPARGKPALIFGQAWFRSCEGVFYTPDRKSLQKTMQRIAQGWTPDPEKVRRFVHAMERTGIRGYHDRDNERNAGISQEENVAALEEALWGYWEKERVSS
jgi:hypothetical protein